MLLYILYTLVSYCNSILLNGNNFTYNNVYWKKYKRLRIKTQLNSPKQDTSLKYNLERGILENTDEENKRGIHWINNFLRNFIWNLWETPKLCIKCKIYDGTMRNKMHVLLWRVWYGHASLFLSLAVQKHVKEISLSRKMS